MFRHATLLAAALAWAAFVPAAGGLAQEPKGKAAEGESTPHDEGGKTDPHAGEGAHAAGDGHGHAPHDPMNLAEGNASSQLGAAQELRFDLAIATFVVFILLLAILTKFAWGPISRALDLREETIARQIEEARLASEKAAHQLQEYEARLAAATEEARQIVGQSRKDAEAAKDKIMAEARELAQKEREKAVADITSAKNQALAEIAQKSVSTAVTLAGKIVRREIKPQDHEALIGDALGQFTKLN
jgi:F-type H+-transporting ATPase subunit b